MGPKRGDTLGAAVGWNGGDAGESDVPGALRGM